MTWALHRHDARHISELLDPESVDLIVTSPPYFALRSYRDGGEHYDGQVGSEATPGEFVDALIACTADWLKVLRPGGSLFVNLGDKYAGSGGHNNATLTASNWDRGWQPGSAFDAAVRPSRKRRADEQNATRRNAPDRYNQSSDGIAAKSRMGLPWRYTIRCIDELGLILRADIIWSKPNGLPESVTDRVRMSHEYLFHFTRQGRYFAAIDEVREPHTYGGVGVSTAERKANGWPPNRGTATGTQPMMTFEGHPLGKVPGSVWTMPSEPLVVPDHLGVDHFAAYPSELPRRCILGWTPSGWCTECGEARRPVVDRSPMVVEPSARRLAAQATGNASRTSTSGTMLSAASATITGYACACPTTDAPTRPAVVLDPFAGTGTTPAVAHLLGRHGVGVDLSADYLRLAEWRCSSDQRLRDKVLDRSGIPNPEPPKVHGQLGLFGEAS